MGKPDVFAKYRYHVRRRGQGHKAVKVTSSDAIWKWLIQSNVHTDMNVVPSTDRMLQAGVKFVDILTDKQILISLFARSTRGDIKHIKNMCFMYPWI